MLIKYKDVRLKQSVKKTLEKYFHVCGVFTIFFRKGAPNFGIFSSVFFGRINLKHLENKKCYGGVREHAPPEYFLKIYIL